MGRRPTSATKENGTPGVQPGDDSLRRTVVAGRYCVERVVFDTGPAGGEVIPFDMCFDVAADETTFVGTLTARGSELVLLPEGRR